CYNRSKMKFIFQHCCEMKFHFGDNSRILRSRIAYALPPSSRAASRYLAPGPGRSRRGSREYFARQLKQSSFSFLLILE
ncbi:hypothetical protein, partial [Klebsiella quasipneumoniae]|uniref:hypothetical protein n=1 Tax=Klebsiella quasipneumoniae TaxID=1463165 RepID=UPI001C6081D2